MTENYRPVCFLLVTLAVTMTACGGPAAIDRGSEISKPAPAKRVVAAITGDPHTFSNKLNPGNDVPGVDRVEDLIHAGLAHLDNRGQLIPRLAEGVPSVENGLWKVLPDGRMETTWRIRQGIQWHDSAAFSAQDVLFTATVLGDRDLPVLQNPTYDLIEAMEIPDPLTIVVRWKAPFIDADALFADSRGLPLPRHILEVPYLAEKPDFTLHPYWSSEFIGVGAFKIRQWERGSHVILEANDRYVLGRPRIDEIEVKFIPDQNTLIANVLAGTVEVVLSRGLSLDQGLTARDAWRDGKMAVTHRNRVSLYPQFNDPDPPVILDVRFRRALLHTIDRQQLADVV